MSRCVARLYAKMGRPSIPPEQLLRALLLQVLYSVRSKCVLMEELQCTLLFRWFVGLNIDDPVWHPATFAEIRVSCGDAVHVASCLIRRCTSFATDSGILNVRYTRRPGLA